MKSLSAFLSHVQSFFLIPLNSILCSLVNSLFRINFFHRNYKRVCMFINVLYTHTRKCPSQSRLKNIIPIKSNNNFKFCGIKNEGISSTIKAEVIKCISE